MEPVSGIVIHIVNIILADRHNFGEVSAIFIIARSINLSSRLHAGFFGENLLIYLNGDRSMTTHFTFTAWVNQ